MLATRTTFVFLALAVFCHFPVPAGEPNLPPSQNVASGIRPIPAQHLENVFSLGAGIFSGSSPESRSAFAELQALGIKTVISVDGAKPLLELAHEFGMRYIHLPIGYNGASPEKTALLVKAARANESNVYVHCHHGKHRGPAAAALICKANSGWSDSAVLDWLKVAGTSLEYPGLFQMAAQFTPPTAEQLAALPQNFPEAAAQPGLVETMVSIDRHWENLLLFERAGYKIPPNHPDLAPARDAILLLEFYKELRRDPGVEKLGPKFASVLEDAEQRALQLQTFLQTGQIIGPEHRTKARDLWQKAAISCASCHKQFRN